ncbi:MAG: alanine racemase [Breznakia sp.]
MLYRDTYIEIDLDAFRHNIQQVQQASKKQVFCVCKANAYGHSDYYIAKTAAASGCAYVCVSSLDEAVSLRQQHLKNDILILGYIAPKDIEIALKYQISVTCTSLDWALQVCALDLDLSSLIVHLKVDTGMNRIGMKHLTNLKKAFLCLQAKRCIMEGIFTHFHSADAIEKTSCKKQLVWFYAMVDELGYDFKWIHTQNSDASLSYEDDRSNAIRVGLVLYGIKSVDNPLNVKAVLSLYSHIVHVKEVMKYETISYGAEYTCLTNMHVATLPIGYGDGFLRANQGRYVSVKGTPCEIIGRICMDQMMIRLPKIYPIGTSVELIGKHTPLSKMALELNMSPYEILCLLNDRITRKIKASDKTIAVLNNRVCQK